jgi:hypothetical protein
MNSVSSKIRWNSQAGKYALAVDGINVRTFETAVIDEFRRDRCRRGQSISSFEIPFLSDEVDGGEVWVDKERKQDLEEFLDFLLKKGLEPRDDL